MNFKNEFQIRRAKESEAPDLSALAVRSKSHWPYEESYLALCRSAVHITSEDILKWPAIVAVKGTRLCGFAAVSTIDGDDMLDHLWVEPEFIGKGLGRILFLEAVACAKALGWSKFQIASDPYAEPFYLKVGAMRIGERRSKVKPDILLPLLEYSF